MERGLLPRRHLPHYCSQLFPCWGARLDLGSGLVWPWDRAAASPVHQLNLGLTMFVTTSRYPRLEDNAWFLEAKLRHVPRCAPSLTLGPTWVTPVVTAAGSHLRSGGIAVDHSFHLLWGHTEWSLQQPASPGWTLAPLCDPQHLPWPPLPPAPFSLPGGAGSLWGWQPALTNCPPSTVWARCPSPVGTWGQDSRGACPPPALDGHSGLSLAVMPGGVAVRCEPCAGRLTVVLGGQQDPKWAHLPPDPLSQE